ncbi:GntR family transcriptional regulator [Pseudaminobacter salicylatoxidans]|uniref:GntR family transcriptional regulator n=1 Tax=Pseudaminobacter salicylatoxidans TaxID=93369 RepID=A0A316C4A1_PSESE|nr:GntR family transcriptional regulator [Pseudaminobacter salicylatoxidans]
MPDLSTHSPIYRAVAAQITERITSGIWPAGTVLPSETALAQEFRVAVGTIRRALGELTAEGSLVRRRKTGTVVTGRTPRHNLRFYFHYFRLNKRSGEMQNSVPHVTAVTRRVATAHEAQSLAIDETDPVIHIHRVRAVDGRPVMHEEVIIPAALVPEFPLTAADVPERLYPMFWERYGIKIAAIREQIEAELATQEDCRHLGLTAPAAVLVIHEVAYDEQARPVLMNIHRATTANDVYVNEIQ